MLALDGIYVCLPYEVFVIDRIGPNQIGVMVINVVAGHGYQIMFMKFWPSYRNAF